MLYNAMVAIDAVKTLYFPSDKDMEVINNKYDRKAHFLQYREPKENVNPFSYQYTYGLLDDFSNVVKKQLLDVIDESNKRFSNNADIIQSKLINDKYNENDYLSCFEAISDLYEQYTNERQTADKKCLKDIKSLCHMRHTEEEKGTWSKYKDDYCEASIKQTKADKYKRFKAIDAEYIVKAEAILQKYDKATVANAIGNLEKCTEDFIINLFFPVFEFLNEHLKSPRYVFVKDQDGDISFLHEKYKKVKLAPMDNAHAVKNFVLEDKKRLKVIDVKADVRAKVLHKEAIGEVQNELKQNGFIEFDTMVNGNKVTFLKDEKLMFEVFEDWVQIGKDSLLKSSKVKIEMIVDIAKTKQSLKMTATKIVV